MAGHNPHGLCQHRDQQEKNLYLHLESSNTAAAIHREKKLREENSGKKTRRDIPGGRGSSLHTVSRVSTKLLWLYKRFGVHSKIPKGSTAGAQRGTNSLLEFGLGKCNRSGRKFHPEGWMHAQPRDFHTYWRAQSLQKASADLSCAGCMEFSLQEEFCSREGQDTRRGQGKAGISPSAWHSAVFIT